MHQISFYLHAPDTPRSRLVLLTEPKGTCSHVYSVDPVQLYGCFAQFRKLKSQRSRMAVSCL